MESPFSYLQKDDVICALSTAPGTAAIAVIRVSGKDCLALVKTIFKPTVKQTDLAIAGGYTIHHGFIHDGDALIDEVLLSLFKAPHSFTGEDVVEISVHGSPYIQKSLLEILVRKGARMARPGEFTMRAFIKGKYDLSQAEAIADLIASNSSASHDLALQQMRGGYSHKIKELRQQLLDLTALFELELDFSEEDVEFADRKQFKDLLAILKQELEKLIASFSLGNVLKHGIPVAIIGSPNVGKSTLLNAILDEERALVSEIPGTTRDSIEDVLNIQGTSFRFIDTAGLRETLDQVESMGIERTYAMIAQSSIVLYVFDLLTTTYEDLLLITEELEPEVQSKGKHLIFIGNKVDLLVESPHHLRDMLDLEVIFISAKRKENISSILDSLLANVEAGKASDEVIVSNARHFDALQQALIAIDAVAKGLGEGVPTDLVAIDLRTALHQLGLITGTVSSQEVLATIFGRFCIGK
ncbi:MAG: tRNA uridine-5-carboxymethylaminomethyl(34) synthesis GTPase MnmE [Bacteroidota bacterium]